MKENSISYDIRGAAFRVYNELGPGLFESVYEEALSYEIERRGHKIRRQVGIPMKYKHLTFNIGYRLDILVDNKVIVEIKSVETLLNVHRKQLLTYLALSDKRLGLLINFNSDSLTHSIVRIVNGL